MLGPTTSPRLTKTVTKANRFAKLRRSGLNCDVARPSPLEDHDMTRATALTDRFDRALLYATHIHGGQVRKGTLIPYIAHLLAVAATVLEYNGSEDMAIAALLHDAAEVTSTPARAVAAL